MIPSMEALHLFQLLYQIIVGRDKLSAHLDSIIWSLRGLNWGKYYCMQY